MTTMNTRACRIDFAFHTIKVTNKFMNEASKPFSDEYRMLTNLMKEHPDYSVEIIRTRRSRIWMPTYEEMMMRMEQHPDQEELMAEFEYIRRMSIVNRKGYMFVRDWFISRVEEGQNMSVDNCIFA